MYVVRCDDQILYNSLASPYDLEEPILHFRANDVSSFEFTINDTHPMYDNINMLASRIKVFKDGNLVWLGRPQRLVYDYGRSKRIYCEDCVSFLKDSYIAPYDYSGSVSDFFEMLVGCHNNSVSQKQVFAYGICTVDNSNENIERSSINYASTYEVFQEKLIKKLGGYLYITYTADDEPIINYYKDVPYTSTQKIEIGENLVSCEQSLFFENVYTACIPLGKKSNNGERRLTIASANNGFDYLYDEDLVEVYGYRYAPTGLTTWDDIELPYKLKVKGQEWLNANGIVYKESIELDAIDISRIKQGVDSFEFLWKVGFKFRNGSVSYYVVADLVTNIALSANISMTLGESKKVYTSMLSGNISNVTNIVNEIYSDYTTYQQSQQISETTIHTTTEIQTQAASIIAQVLESYYTASQIDARLTEQALDLRAAIQLLSDSVTTSFSYYESVTNDLGSTVTDIQSWVKIVPETPTQSIGLIIGNSASEIKLKLENDTVYFYKGDDSNPIILMYIDSTTIHVDRVEIQHLSIGDEGRMLDFRIIGSGVNTCVMFSGRLES